MGIRAGSDIRRAPSARAPSSWPFRAPPHIAHSDVSVHGVGVPNRSEVQFRDGKLINLRRVMKDGAPDLYLRDLEAPAEGVRIDLRDFIQDVESELPTTSTRDVAGYVAYSLKHRFPTLDAFLEAASKAPRAR